MKHLTRSRLQAFPCLLVSILSFLICAGLGVGSLFYLSNIQIEKVYIEFDLPESTIIAPRNLLCSVAGFLLMSLYFVMLVFFFRRFISWRTAHIFSIVGAFVQSLIALWWKGSFSSYPVADQFTFWDVANHLAYQTNATSDMVDYLRYWPFQGSGALLAVPIVRLFHGSYSGWQFFNVFCVGACFFLLCSICGRITQSPVGQLLCALLLTCFSAPALYSTFIYGTVPGMAFAFLGIYAVIRQFDAANRRSELRWLLISAFSFFLSIVLYTGEQIFLVAASLVLLVSGLFHAERHRQIIYSVLLLAVPIFLSKAWQILALSLLGMGNEPGCPIWPRIAMGMDAFTTVSPGMYNALNVKLYQESGYDPSLANQLALAYLQRSLHTLHSDGQLWHFLTEKTASQWFEPWFGGLTMNNPSLFNEQKWLAQALTGGVLFSPVQALLCFLLSTVYLWAAVGIAWLARHRKEVWQLSLAVCLIGGFLFQLAAEAKARYCLPYYLCCFPLAAAGLCFAVQRLTAWWDRRKKQAGERPAK